MISLNLSATGFDDSIANSTTKTNYSSNANHTTTATTVAQLQNNVKENVKWSVKSQLYMSVIQISDDIDIPGIFT